MTLIEKASDIVLPKSKSSLKFSLRKIELSSKKFHLLMFILSYLILTFIFASLIDILPNLYIGDYVSLSYIFSTLTFSIVFSLIHYLLFNEKWSNKILFSSIKWLFFAKIFFDLILYYVFYASSYFYPISIFIATYFAINSFFDFNNEFKYRFIFAFGWSFSWFLSGVLTNDELLYLLLRTLFSSGISILFWKYFNFKLFPWNSLRIFKLFSFFKLPFIIKNRERNNNVNIDVDSVIHQKRTNYSKPRVSKYLIIIIILFLAVGSLFLIKIECNECMGNGSVSTRYTCTYCKGRGQTDCTYSYEVEPDWIAKMLGDNQNKSYWCSGGKIRSQYRFTDNYCPNCNGKAVQDCEDCNGYGYTLISDYCYKCDGSGKYTIFTKLFD
ncbi:MAG: hypothetical protein K9I95_14485 [Flavobacteriaceae bacterium]|nr:hypothetical protein [Flavobacteriaceae bacterium]